VTTSLKLRRKMISDLCSKTCS